MVRFVPDGRVRDDGRVVGESREGKERKGDKSLW